MSRPELAKTAVLEARYSIPGHLLVLALTLALLIPAMLMLQSGWEHRAWLGLSVGLLGTAFFGPIALMLLVRLFDRRVRLRITDDSIWIADHSGAAIPLRSVRQISDMGPWIALWLYKPERYPPTTRAPRPSRACGIRYDSALPHTPGPRGEHEWYSLRSATSSELVTDYRRTLPTRPTPRPRYPSAVSNLSSAAAGSTRLG